MNIELLLKELFALFLKTLYFRFIIANQVACLIRGPIRISTLIQQPLSISLTLNVSVEVLCFLLNLMGLGTGLISSTGFLPVMKGGKVEVSAAIRFNGGIYLSLFAYALTNGILENIKPYYNYHHLESFNYIVNGEMVKPSGIAPAEFPNIDRPARTYYFSWLFKGGKKSLVKIESWKALAPKYPVLLLPE